ILLEIPLTLSGAYGYYRGLVLRALPKIRVPNKRAIVRALILFSSLGLMLSTLSTSASQELCRDALMARNTVKETASVAAALDAFYAKSGKACVWDERSADALIAAIQAAPEHGLDPELFGAHSLSARRGASDDASRASLDLRLTAAAFKYA